jgi:NitT/TauT family transport system substrate-binding protein
MARPRSALCTLITLSALALVAAGCGGAPASSSGSGSAPAAPAPASSKPAAPAAAPAALTPFKVSVSAPGGPYLPADVALYGGYFKQHGLNVTFDTLGAAAAVAALVSGNVEMYQGGAAAVGAHLNGSDIIYIASPVDRSSEVLFAQKGSGIASFPQLRGKTVASDSAGAFGTIILRATAKKYGMVPGKDFQISYNKNSPAIYGELTSGKVQAAIFGPPWATEAKAEGYPVIIDFGKVGFKVIGPAMIVQRSFYESHQALLKQYMEGYLDGLKRALDDPAYAYSIQQKVTGASLATAKAAYTADKAFWNENMTVDPASIQVVLDNSNSPKAAQANVKNFYDNTLIDQVNSTYAKKLFPQAFGG